MALQKHLNIMTAVNLFNGRIVARTAALSLPLAPAHFTQNGVRFTSFHISFQGPFFPFFCATKFEKGLFLVCFLLKKRSPATTTPPAPPAQSGNSQDAPSHARIAHVRNNECDK